MPVNKQHRLYQPQTKPPKVYCTMHLAITNKILLPLPQVSLLVKILLLTHMHAPTAHIYKQMEQVEYKLTNKNSNYW